MLSACSRAGPWTQVVSYWHADLGMTLDKASNIYIAIGVVGVFSMPLLGIVADREFFGWLERERENEEDIELVTYLTGIRPTRIAVVNLDDDGEEDDLLIPNSFDGEGGNSVNLFYGLGKDNYTNADIYWVDMQPQLLSPQQWYLRHSVGPNFFQLVIDPALFWPQSQQPPESFIVDFMTGTRSIVYEDDPEWLGEIRDHLNTPVGVPITVDHFDDEQNSPRALEQIANDSEDIDFWEVEVF